MSNELCWGILAVLVVGGILGVICWEGRRIQAKQHADFLPLLEAILDDNFNLSFACPPKKFRGRNITFSAEMNGGKNMRRELDRIYGGVPPEGINSRDIDSVLLSMVGTRVRDRELCFLYYEHGHTSSPVFGLLPVKEAKDGQ